MCQVFANWFRDDFSSGGLFFPASKERRARINTRWRNLSDEPISLAVQWTPSGDDDIAQLLRLKRYEQPPPAYFENFPHEFPRRQRECGWTEQRLSQVVKFDEVRASLPAETEPVVQSERLARELANVPVGAT